MREFKRKLKRKLKSRELSPRGSPRERSRDEGGAQSELKFCLRELKVVLKAS